MKKNIKIILLIYVIIIIRITLFPINPVIRIQLSFIDYNLIPFQFLKGGFDKIQYFLSPEHTYCINIIASTLIDMYKNFACNILLFCPLGFLLPMLYEINNRLKRIIVISFASSVSIEVLQLIIIITTITPGRAFDIDDIIANTIGGIIGFYFFVICNKFYKKKLLNRETLHP